MTNKNVKTWKFFFLLFCLPTILFCQSFTCGTKKPTGANLQKLSFTLPPSVQNVPDTCLNKELSVVFHVVLDSNYAPGINLNTALDTAIAKLNRGFKPICLSFKRCSLNLIKNYNYNIFKVDSMMDAIMATDYVPKVINIYIVDEIISNADGSPAGVGFMPGGPDAIFICRTSIASDKVLNHEMGHFFGLFHTFETDFGTSLVNGSNCATTGDLICDTEADPYPNGRIYSAPCEFQPGPADLNGHYFIPPLGNTMSYWGCYCGFSVQQFDRMVYNYLHHRFYLW